MEWLWILIGLIALLAILSGAKNSSGTEYHPPPDYEDDPPPPMGASQEAIDAFDRKHHKKE